MQQKTRNKQNMLQKTKIQKYGRNTAGIRQE